MLLLLVTLELMLVYTDMGACRSPQSHAAVVVADYAGVHARAWPIRVRVDVLTLVLLLPVPFVLELMLMDCRYGYKWR